MGARPPPGFFDEGANHHIRSHVGRLQPLHKFAVAVVHHDLDAGLDLLAEANQFPNLLHGKAGTGGVALGALDGDEFCAPIDFAADGVVVKRPVRLQIRLGVGDAVLLQGALALPDADDLLQRVIGSTHGREQLIARQEVGGEGHRQGMGAAGDLGTHQGGLRMEDVGIDPLQVVPALVVIAVASGGGEVGGVHPVFLHGADDLALVVLRHGVDGVEPLAQVPQHGFPVFVYSPADAQLLIHFLVIQTFQIL